MYAESDGEGGDGVPSFNSNGHSEDLEAEVNDALENYSNLQYHFFCGRSWIHADGSCDTFCPSGDKKDCPAGMDCFANTKCDGRDTAPPTASPDPESQGAFGHACTICMSKETDSGRQISFNGKLITYGDMEQQLEAQRIHMVSDTCTKIEKLHQQDCCFVRCDICWDGRELLDLRGDRLVRQGDHEASCLEIDSMLRSSDEKDEICVDARAQLGDACCYEQCKLCGGAGAGRDNWESTVTFEGMTTSCLGLDFMLRREEVSEGGSLCGQFREEYGAVCCGSPSSDAPPLVWRSSLPRRPLCRRHLLRRHLLERLPALRGGRHALRGRGRQGD